VRRRTGSRFRYAPSVASAAVQCLVRTFTDESLNSLLVAEVKEALNNQGLEHQNHIQWLAPGRTFPIRFAQSLSQNRTKHLEINSLGQLLKRVIQTTQCGKTLAFIEKGNLV
jgi:hypothetical protein